ncbi:MAG: enoyl-CoA hydratase [Actinomycetota bacterium]|nr:enoyl-CoA hydratase [Actinomycetota bacterium]
MNKVRLEDRGDGVRLLTLTDPDRRNAMGAQMGAELIAACHQVREDAQARVLVVTGEGRAFCAGADLPALFGDPDRPVTDTHRGLQTYYQAFFSVLQLPLPTIAAVNGPAVGAGLNLALACDVRIAGAAASFGATFAKIGLHPGGGCTWFLVQALGASRALQTLLLADSLDAARAVEWGLAEGVAGDPVADALEMAERFAAVAPELARSIKRSVGIAVRTGDLEAVVEYESWAQAASAGSPVLQAWVAKFS